MAQTAEAEQFAARLRILKDRAGESFETLAGRSGISRSSLHRYYAGAGFPAGYETVHAFAKACGASGEELRELYRLWVLADIARSSSTLPGSTVERGETEDGETAGPRQPRKVTLMSWARLRARRPIPAVVVAAFLAVTAVTVFVVLGAGRGLDLPVMADSRAGGAPVTVPVRIFNIEGGCRVRVERVPACSMGLARNPRLKYDAANVVGHRVWHDDVLNADCVLYDGDRVEDETGVGTTRWFRVRLDDVPGGFAWLPAVRTNDGPALPTCA
ncbi:helix-turn-helix domain-containing protein [Streptosporangium sp. CA-135522]|uniref:helix-turn-helix domain-containing protein n=1 Tax=Streptosporangium sp. CA-135522 TaxID=3240072 RepID=UPI003D8EF565